MNANYAGIPKIFACRALSTANGRCQAKQAQIPLCRVQALWDDSVEEYH